jgi:hypothetical protein
MCDVPFPPPDQPFWQGPRLAAADSVHGDRRVGDLHRGGGRKRYGGAVQAGDDTKKFQRQCTGPTTSGSLLPWSAASAHHMHGASEQTSEAQTSPNAASLCLCDQTALLAGIRGGSGCSKQSRDPHSPAATPAPRVATSPAIHPSPQSVPARPPARAAATMLHSRSTSTHHAAPIAPVSPSPLLDTAATR